MLVCSGPDPLPLPPSTPGLWKFWAQASKMLGFMMAAGLFISSVGLYLWKPWARKLLIGVCVYGLASLVIEMPYLAQAEIPNLAADMRAFFATEGLTPEGQDVAAPLAIAGLLTAMLCVSLPWLIGQLVYFNRTDVVTAFTDSSPHCAI